MVWFWDTLEKHQARIALTSSSHHLNYAELAALADDFAAKLGSSRQLVMLEASNTITSIIALLGCLRGRHPVILSSAATNAQIRQTFQPNVIIDSYGSLSRHSKTVHGLHPDLGLMLSTSGSTGTAKLVRLSYDALHANAASIADFLAIGERDVPITTLPIAYSYGLSVITSHLSAGARIVLTNRSVVDEEFWTLFETERATSLAGVPYTYELLETYGLRARSLPNLRTMTQAGGRINPKIRAAFSQWATEHGIRFFVMYGQTEATARMAYLPPELQTRHGDCIGIAIPGGSLRIEGENRRQAAPGSIGELVYSGPNVMMGYATEIDDLRLAQESRSLRTGDLAEEVKPGLFRIVGRLSRFSKIAGLRISLDEIEQRLAKNGIAAIVSGDDDLVGICLEDAHQYAAAEEIIATQMTIPARSRLVFALDLLPRLSSGKPDYPAILKAAKARKAALDASRTSPKESALAATYARALNLPSVDMRDSFASLGGDSLGYIEVSMAIEQMLGYLPEAWQDLSIAQIEQLEASATHAQNKRWITVQSEMLIRPIAMTTVVTNHVLASMAPDRFTSDLGWGGGALVLLTIAGYNACRFQKEKLLSPQRMDVVYNFVKRFILPYYVVILSKAALWFAGGTYVAWSTFLLIDEYFAKPGQSDFSKYWFLEVLIKCLFLMAILLQFRGISAFARKSGFHFGVMIFAAAYAIKIAADVYIQSTASAAWIEQHPHRLDFWAYAFALGWMASEAKKPWQRAFCLCLGAATSVASWGLIDLHGLFLSVALTLIFYAPQLRLPSLMGRTFSFWAQSTFYIYLAHGAAIRLMQGLLGNGMGQFAGLIIAATIVVSTLFGFVFYLGWTQIEQSTSQLWRKLRQPRTRLVRSHRDRSAIASG